jgi:hypothetical protein
MSCHKALSSSTSICHISIEASLSLIQTLDLFLFLESVLFRSLSYPKNRGWILHVLDRISSLQKLIFLEFIFVGSIKLNACQLIKLHVQYWCFSVSFFIFVVVLKILGLSLWGHLRSFGLIIQI